MTPTLTGKMGISVNKPVALSCVTAAEDKDLDDEALRDIRSVQLASSESKTSNALVHFDFFLTGYFKKIKSPIINSCHLTYYGVKTTGTVEEANVWWDNVIGNFFTYLHKDAYKCLDPDKG